nr:FAD-dependent oxidoreductase [Victivallales bacterium]
MKIIIVGGVAGGMSCAARARRLDENAEIIILERSSYVSFANCGLPYHIGGIIGDRDELILHTPESLAELLNLDVRIRNEAVSIDRKRKIVKVRNMADGGEYEESYDKLVLSPGAVPLKPPLHGIDNPKIFFLRNIEDMDAIKSVVDSGKVKSAVVVGGGYIGVEIAENLVLRGIEVD